MAKCNALTGSAVKGLILHCISIRLCAEWCPFVWSIACFGINL